MEDKIISIGGDLGSGKSTVGKMLAKKLGFNHYSTGDFMRAVAQKKGMDFIKFSELVAKAVESGDFSMDYEIDDYQKELAKKEKNFVIDSRLAFHFIPHSVKFFLKVDERVAAERTFNANRDDEKHTSVENTMENIRKRKEIEIQRYSKIYGVDRFNLEHYDHVIDTSEMTPEEVVDLMIEKIQES